MEHVIAGYLRQVWDASGWLYEGQHGFRPGYSFESQLVTVCQDIADSMDGGVRTGAVTIDFSKPFDLAPHDRLIMKIAATGVDLRVVSKLPISVICDTAVTNYKYPTKELPAYLLLVLSTVYCILTISKLWVWWTIRPMSGESQCNYSKSTQQST